MKLKNIYECVTAGAVAFKPYALSSAEKPRNISSKKEKWYLRYSAIDDAFLKEKKKENINESISKGYIVVRPYKKGFKIKTSENILEFINVKNDNKIYINNDSGKEIEFTLRDAGFTNENEEYVTNNPHLARSYDTGYSTYYIYTKENPLRKEFDEKKRYELRNRSNQDNKNDKDKPIFYAKNDYDDDALYRGLNSDQIIRKVRRKQLASSHKTRSLNFRRSESGEKFKYFKPEGFEFFINASADPDIIKYLDIDNENIKDSDMYRAFVAFMNLMPMTINDLDNLQDFLEIYKNDRAIGELMVEIDYIIEYIYNNYTRYAR